MADRGRPVSHGGVEGVEADARLRRAGLFAVRTLAVVACYFLAGRLGLLRRLEVDGAVVTPIWPPTGVAVAALLLHGLRMWPGIAIGALVVVCSIDPPQPDVIGTVAGNTAAPVCACLLLRAVGFRTDLGRLRDGLALVFLGALGAMLISSTAGTGLLVLTGKLEAGGFWAVWLAWWVGDAMGVLIVTPALLLVVGARARPDLRRWKEALALAVIGCAAVLVATRSDLSVLFVVYPMLIWAALRFRFAGSLLCALFASVMTTVAATEGAGPFRHLSHVEVMVKLQAFNGTTALTALLLSAVITEQYRTRQSVEHACEELAEVLDRLSVGETRQDRLSPARHPPA